MSVCACVSGSSCSLPDSLSLPLTYSVLQWRMGSLLPPAGTQTSETVSVKEKLTEIQRGLPTTKRAAAPGLKEGFYSSYTSCQRSRSNFATVFFFFCCRSSVSGCLFNILRLSASRWSAYAVSNTLWSALYIISINLLFSFTNSYFCFYLLTTYGFDNVEVLGLVSAFDCDGYVECASLCSKRK